MRAAALFFALAFLAPSAAAQSTSLDPMTSGASKLIGGPRLRTVELSSTKPASITKLPTALTAPIYGIIPIGPRPEAGGAAAQNFHICLDQPKGPPHTLFVDANGNGDLTDDPVVQWLPNPYRGLGAENLTGHEGGATLELRDGDVTFPARIGLSRYDPSDAARPQAATSLTFFADYARVGQLTLPTGTYKVMLSDDLAAGDFRPQRPAAASGARPSGIRIFIDIDADDKFQPKEIFDAAATFKIGTSSFEVAMISPLGDEIVVTPATRPSAPGAKPRAPRSGATLAKTFQAKSLDGKTISMPASYQGKVVLLDFWATWCGPCMQEVPNLVSAYDAHRTKGLEILGVSLDGANARDEVLATAKRHGMNWPQIYDGKEWKARIAVLYGIKSIPAAFLIDGDTGEILASGRSLRGSSLSPTIEQALARKARK